ncbi:MAG: dockerin type I repeat-containing protein, partial [Ruminococcus sp.]|nr:dockerin type I repeat-containing protein [Ruminococcus sp.]
MKKTEKTILTAALFAAALNMIPSGTSNIKSSALASDYNNSSDEPMITTTAYNPNEGMEVPVYGPPISWTTTEPVPTTVTTTVPMPVYGPPLAWYGDINEDGKVNVFDMIELRKAYINGEVGKGLDYMRADINRDGKIGMADLVMLENYLLGKIDNFDNPLPEPVPTTAEPQYSFINATTNPEP